MFYKIQIVFILLLVSCKSQQQQQSLPNCVDSLIKEFKSKPRTNPGKSIYQYEYNGQVVYFVPQVCCDIPSYLYDSNCKLICMPDGGFTGRGDGKCTDFFKTRTKEKLIWKDDRK